LVAKSIDEYSWMCLAIYINTKVNRGFLLPLLTGLGIKF